MTPAWIRYRWPQRALGQPESQAASDAQAAMQLETAPAKVSMDVTSQRDPAGGEYRNRMAESLARKL
jgi:hypothetical protein